MWSNFIRWVRSKSDDQKQAIRHRLALVYAITAWNSVILFFYLNMKDNLPTDDESRMRFVEKMKKKNKEVEFITVRGFEVHRNEPKFETESASEELKLDNESSLS